MIKGPLSRRHNYLKSLYTQSSTNSQPSSPSPSLSTSTDSDIEMYESSFSISESTLSEMSPTSNSQPDIANMNDFYDANIDMNIQSTENSLESLIDLDEEVKIQFSDEIKIEKVFFCLRLEKKFCPFNMKYIYFSSIDQIFP